MHLFYERKLLYRYTADYLLEVRICRLLFYVGFIDYYTTSVL